MKLKSILFTCTLLSIIPCLADEATTITCASNPSGTVMIEEDRLYVVVDNKLIRDADYWQNFLDGNIQLCTTHVTDMSDLFANNKFFNQDISQWDTSHVTNMDRMFSAASRFNRDLSTWSVEHVKHHADFSRNSGLSGDSLPVFPQ